MPYSIIAGQNPICRRSVITAALCFSGIAATGCFANARAKRPAILFVCQAGTAKSAIAREIFKKRAKERGIDTKVFSRGLLIEDHISPELRQKLLADGIDTTAESARTLIPSDWAAADIMVIFNPLPTSINHADVRNWSDVPSVNGDYVNALALIVQRIDLLLTEIAAMAK
jgi:Low molecular weight phosphotyrosine protein phosphatase